MTIRFYNKLTNDYRDATLGFSWTSLCFGFMVPLIQGDGKWALIQILFFMATQGWSWLVMPFFYNEIHIKTLLKQGYLPIDEENTKLLVKNLIITPEHITFLKQA